MPYRTPPIAPTPGAGRVVRQERAAIRREHQETIDRASTAHNTLTESVNTYNAQVRQTVVDTKPKRRSKTTLGDDLAKTQAAAQSAIASSTRSSSSLALTGDRLETTLQEAEVQARQFEDLARDFDDPLAEDLFTTSGKRKAVITAEIGTSVREIDRAIKQLDAVIATPTAETAALITVRDELQRIRDRVLNILNTLSSSSDLKQQQGQLIRDLELELSQLRAIIPTQAGEYYADIQQLIQRTETFLNQVRDNAQTDLVQSLDGQIAALNEQITLVQSQQGQQDLVAARDALIEKRERLRRAIPARIEDLTPEQQQAYQLSKQQRQVIDNANRALNVQLKAYRRNIEKRFSELLERGERYFAAMEEWETPGSEPGTRLYDERRASAIASVESTLQERNVQIQQRLNQLRLLADPAIGIGYVMGRLPTYDTAGLQEGLGAVRDIPIGLDAAVEIKRRAVRTLKAQLYTTEGAAGLVNQIEGILDYDTVRRVTTEKLTAVQAELAFWQSRQSRFINATQSDAAKVIAEIELLRETDLIAYNIARDRFDAVRAEIATNQRLLQSEFDTRIAALQQYQARLQQDLDTDIPYQLGNERLTKQAIQERAVAIRTEVTQLGIRTQKAALEDVWVKSAQRGISPTRLQQMAADPEELAAVFTPTEIQTIQAATAGGKNSAFALYQELAALSDEMRSLQQSKDRIWSQVQAASQDLERNYGYRLTFQITPENDLLVSELEDIEPNRAQRFKGGKDPTLVLNKIFGLTGVRQIGNITRAPAGKDILTPPAITRPSPKTIASAQTTVATQRKYGDNQSGLMTIAESITQALDKTPGTRYAKMSDKERYLAILRLMQRQVDTAYTVDTLAEKLGVASSENVEAVRLAQSQIMSRLQILYNTLFYKQASGTSKAPTTLVDILNQLQINTQRRLEVDRRLEVAGFNRRRDAIAQFNRRMRKLKKQW
jgi:hypothetical protein